MSSFVSSCQSQHTHLSLRHKASGPTTWHPESCIARWLPERVSPPACSQPSPGIVHVDGQKTWYSMVLRDILPVLTLMRVQKPGKRDALLQILLRIEMNSGELSSSINKFLRIHLYDKSFKSQTPSQWREHTKAMQTSIPSVGHAFLASSWFCKHLHCTITEFFCEQCGAGVRLKDQEVVAIVLR